MRRLGALHVITYFSYISLDVIPTFFGQPHPRKNKPMKTIFNHPPLLSFLPSFLPSPLNVPIIINYYHN